MADSNYYLLISSLILNWNSFWHRSRLRAPLRVNCISAKLSEGGGRVYCALLTWIEQIKATNNSFWVCKNPNNLRSVVIPYHNYELNACAKNRMKRSCLLLYSTVPLRVCVGVHCRAVGTRHAHSTIAIRGRAGMISEWGTSTTKIMSNFEIQFYWCDLNDTVLTVRDTFFPFACFGKAAPRYVPILGNTTCTMTKSLMR